MALGPITTERRIVQPIWGGTRLAAWLDLPEPRPIRLGETWQVYDQNLVTSPPHAGQTLSDLTAQYGADLVGTRTMARYGADFPLLAKFIDAADRLSIQVHPDDAYAHRVEAHSGFHGKTEAWYILDAAPGATVTCGLTRVSDREEFAAAVADGTLEALMGTLPVAPGDVIFVPAGTIHAINAGIVLFEIQQKSDLTYRVYDYGRRDATTGQLRPLHLERALEVSQFAPATQAKVTPLRLSPGRDLLIACPYFALERWQVSAPLQAQTEPGSFALVTVLEGSGQLRWEAGTLTLARGDSLVLPASLGAWALAPQTANLDLLYAYVPDLDDLTHAARLVASAERVAEVVRSA